jgi:hypothetical protein
VQEGAPNALEAVTEPEGETEEAQPALDEAAPTVSAGFLFAIRPCMLDQGEDKVVV